ESLNVQDVKTNLFWEFGKFTSRDGESMEMVSYHKLFDVLKQFQNEVNDIRSERLARSANPLALLAAALIPIIGSDLTLHFINHNTNPRN
ncbi:hypothetical protein Tco_1232343, partial [Tanacetum coccineum]